MDDCTKTQSQPAGPDAPVDDRSATSISHVSAGRDGGGDPVAVLTRARELLNSLAGVDWAGLPGPILHESIDQLEQVTRRSAAARARVLAAAETEGSWALDGQRTFTTWLRDRTGVAPGAAHRQVRTARRLRDLLPQAEATLQAGHINEDHIAVLVREAAKTARLRQALADPDHGESLLLPMARCMDAGQFTKAVKAWTIRVDPDGADRAWREAGTAAEICLAPTMGGWHLSGWLDDHGGGLLHTALEAFTGRRAADDHRSRPQRLADGLVAMAGHALDSGAQGEHARVRPHLTVTVPWDTLQRLAQATYTAVPRQTVMHAHLTGLALGCGTKNGSETAGTVFHAQGDPTKPADIASAASTIPPRDKETGSDAGASPAAGSSSFEESWAAGFTTGDDHVIAARYDPTVMIGAEPATFADGTPIPHGLLARIACSSQLARIIFGPGSTILDSGRETRIFTAAQTRAIIARDRHCRYPGCQEPPGRGEIHHSLWWGKHQGPTNADHGILLCWHHHTLVHTRDITIARVNGQWIFTDRHGHPISPDRYGLSS